MNFLVEVEPTPQSRPRFGCGRCYEPARVTEYKKAVSYAAKVAMQGKPPTKLAVRVKLRLYRKYAATSRRYGDCDNHLKAVLDACNKIIFSDDSQVISATVEKFQGTPPKLEIEIEEVEK